MSFTKQDAITFIIGLVAGVGWELADKLQDSEAITSDPVEWGISLGIGALAAVGRWLATYLALKGFSRN